MKESWLSFFRTRSKEISPDDRRERDRSRGRNEGNRRPKRPGGSYSGRPHSPRSGNRDPNQGSDEQEFQQEILKRIGLFIKSPDDSQELEPMNSFHRRLVHQLANLANLDSETMGEGRERWVKWNRTTNSYIPKSIPAPTDDSPQYNRNQDSNYDDRPRYKSNSGRPPRDSSGRPPRDSSGYSSGRSSGFSRDPGLENKVLSISCGQDGIELALKKDGSINVYQPEDEPYIIHRRLVTEPQVKIKEGRILQPSDADW